MSPLVFFSAYAAQSTGAYTLWSKGPVRHIALSGATVAHPKNAAAFVENQAAIGFQPGWIAGSFAFGAPEDSTLKIENTTSHSQSYLIFGSSFLMGKTFGLGIGAQQIRMRAADQKSADHSSSFEESVLEMNISAAAKFDDNLSLSIAYMRNISRRLRDTYEAGVSQNIDFRQRDDFVKIGALLRVLDRLSFGMTHREASIMAPGENDETTRLFGSSYQPQVSQFGTWLYLGKQSKDAGLFSEFTLSLQADLIAFPNLPDDGEISYPTTVAFEQSNKKSLDTSNKVIPRLGVETILFQKNEKYLSVLMGTYQEPKFFKDSDPRQHLTAGLSFGYWAFSLDLGVDFAKDFMNQNFGFGLNERF